MRVKIGKENGLDVEGLTVHGNKVWIGLRGPVLRGIAILLEIEVEEGSNNELFLKTIGNGDRQYKRHFLDLDGLGIQELCWERNSENLLVLAGPTMDLDGAHSLFRLHQPFSLKDNSFSSQKNTQLLLRQYLRIPKPQGLHGGARFARPTMKPIKLARS